jgi:hypothetical protein
VPSSLLGRDRDPFAEPGTIFRSEVLVGEVQPGRDEGQAPEIVSSDGSYTNFDPTFGGGAASAQGFIQLCTANDLTRSMTIQVTDVNDASFVATATISNPWICGPSLGNRS